jgi:antibiotic biosynthesis monooxygenase (ABM) superfamily enzyme
VSGTGPVTLVLTRHARPGCEEPFEAVLRRISAYARGFPGHQGVTVVRPAVGGAPYTILAHFADPAAADAWLADGERVRLVAEAGRYADDGLEVRTLSGLEGWVRPPGQPVVVPPPRWKVAVATWVGILPVLEVVFFTLVPRLAVLPPPLRPVVLSAVLIPVMTYAVMPLVTRLLRPFLYPTPSREAP